MNATSILATELDSTDHESIKSGKADGTNCKVYDDCGSKWFVIGREFGAELIVRCDSEESAYGIWKDEMRPIDASGIPDAYGIIDWLSDLTERNSAFQPFNWSLDDSNHRDLLYQLSYGLSRKLIDIYFTDDRNSTFDSDDWSDFLHQLDWPLTKRQIRALAWHLEDLADHGWELVEGYEHQDNSTDTGIVDVGHYAWIREIEDKDITLEIEVTV